MSGHCVVRETAYTALVFAGRPSIHRVTGRLWPPNPAPASFRHATAPESSTMSDDQFDRVPPQDIDAEMSVLGSMMLTTDAANVVSEMLRGQDCYQPSHERVFDTIIELIGRAEPADAITVAGELKRAGVLSKVGGAAYLHSLIAPVPPAAACTRAYSSGLMWSARVVPSE